MFKVTLERVLCRSGERERNPFLKRLNLRDTMSVSYHIWEFEARDEKHVRRLHNEAQKQRIDGVVGYALAKIERVVAPPNGDVQ